MIDRRHIAFRETVNVRVPTGTLTRPVKVWRSQALDLRGWTVANVFGHVDISQDDVPNSTLLLTGALVTAFGSGGVQTATGTIGQAYLLGTGSFPLPFLTTQVTLGSEAWFELFAGSQDTRNLVLTVDGTVVAGWETSR